MRRDIQCSNVGEDTTHTFPLLQTRISSCGFPSLKEWWAKSHVQTIDCRNYKHIKRKRLANTSKQSIIKLNYNQNWKMKTLNYTIPSSGSVSPTQKLAVKISIDKIKICEFNSELDQPISSKESAFNFQYLFPMPSDTQASKAENWNNRARQRHELW